MGVESEGLQNPVAGNKGTEQENFQNIASQIWADYKSFSVPVRLNQQSWLKTPEQLMEFELNQKFEGLTRQSKEQLSGGLNKVLDPTVEVKVDENDSLKVSWHPEKIADVQKRDREIAERAANEYLYFEGYTEFGRINARQDLAANNPREAAMSTILNSLQDGPKQELESIALEFNKRSGGAASAKLEKVDGKDYIVITDIEKHYEFPKENGFKSAPAYTQYLSEVFRDATTDLGTNHNMIIDAPMKEIMRKHGIDPESKAAKDQVTLINVDTHVDIYKERLSLQSNENIGNWVNTMLAKNPNINEFYWVMPQELYDNPKYKAKYFDAGTNRDYNLVDAQRDLEIYINNKTNSVEWSKPENYNAADYRMVQIHKRTLSQMPDMKGKNVLLTTDCDYFDNRGFDTNFEAKVPFKGEEGFEDYVRLLKEKNIRPFYHFTSISPDYSNATDLNQFGEFAARISDNADQGGSLFIAHWRNQVNQGQGGAYDGTSISRDRHKDYQVWRELTKIDAITFHPNGEIDIKTPIEKGNLQFKMALQAVQKIYRADEQQALSILKSYDSRDHNRDGFINFRLLEQQVIDMAISLSYVTTERNKRGRPR